MSFAYVDSSVIISILAEEPGSGAIVRKLSGITTVSCLLMEAEVRSFVARHNERLDDDAFNRVVWVTPAALTTSLKKVLTAGYLRGADLYHVACALEFFGEAEGHRFLTLDRNQGEVAARLGFATDWSFA